MCAFLLEVVVDDLPPARAAGQVEVDRSVEPARAQEGGIEIVGPVGGPDEQDVRRRRQGLAQPVVRREPPVRPLDHPTAHPLAERGQVERLQLDQQLVDDTGHALVDAARRDVHVRGTVETHRRGAELAHAAARAGDRVDLLDEADRAAFFARGLAQRLEVVADLAAGLAVVHRLERGRRDEEVRDARFLRHRLRHVGLAGSRRTFEQDRLARVAAHRLAERLVREEQVERLDDLFFHRSESDDVVERDIDLTRGVAHVRRTPRTEQRHDEDDADEQDREDRQQHLQVGLAEVRPREHRGMTREDAPVEPREQRQHPREQLPQPSLPRAFAHPGDVDRRAPQHGLVADRAEVQRRRCREDRRGRTRRTGIRAGSGGVGVPSSCHCAAFHPACPTIRERGA